MCITGLSVCRIAKDDRHSWHDLNPAFRFDRISGTPGVIAALEGRRIEPERL
jgi:hypothetical protein